MNLFLEKHFEITGQKIFQMRIGSK